LAAERAFLTALDGSCETPIAGLALHEGSGLWLRGEILRPDGSEVITGEMRCTIADAAKAGAALARELLSQTPEGFFDWR
jgi:hydroxymethylbilane synthase